MFTGWRSSLPYLIVLIGVAALAALAASRIGKGNPRARHHQGGQIVTETRRISRDDLEAKFRELQTEVEVVEDEAQNYAIVAAVVGVVVVVAIAFLLGRRRGRKRGTVVEIRRI